MRIFVGCRSFCLGSAVLAVLLLSGLSLAAAGQAKSSGAIDLSKVVSSRIRGGLVVQWGGDDLAATTELAKTGRYLVAVYDPRPEVVDASRRQLQVSRLYGLISVDRPTDRAKVPCAENLVNLLILSRGGTALAPAEIQRVVCPGGWAVGPADLLAEDTLLAAGFEQVTPLPGTDWTMGRKPWPKAMDQWPQPRHAADGNAVSHDELVGPPRRVRWIAGPPQEISNMVSAGGRNFYGGLIARDAFNGLHLWQEALDPSPARGGFSYKPKSSAPRPIAVGEEVVCQVGEELVALDGASGAVLRKYSDAGRPLEIAAEGAVLLAVEKDAVRAIEHRTGRLCWKWAAVSPRCLVAGGGGVYFVHGDPKRGDAARLVCLNLEKGTSRWELKGQDWIGKVRQCVYHGCRLVCEISTLADEKRGNGIQVIAAADGSIQGSHEFVPGSTHMKQARAMFVGDALWILTQDGCRTLGSDGQPQGPALRAGGGHCFPPVATTRFLFHGEMDLTDLASGRLDTNPITKGNCSRDIGFMPANGLIYTTPKHCVCWPMLRDYTALAPAKPGRNPSRSLGSGFLLERGPATAPEGVADENGDWPCYRHDAWRSAATRSKLPPDLGRRWSARLGNWPQGEIAADWQTNSYVRGPVTPPVVAGGRVFVARPDAHEIVALDAHDGKAIWRYTANGRIDTPPTLYRGLCLFGTKAGWVYALRADDGRLAWRFRAAATDEQIVAYGQLESPWPVPGSVLVVDDTVYFAAGRQPLADGGIRVVALRPSTGEQRWVQRIDAVPQQSDRVKRPFYNSSGLEFDNFDLLHREGSQVAMSRWLFEPQSGQMTCDRYSGFVHVDPEGTGGVWAPRGCWSYAPRNESEHRRERPFLRPLAAFAENGLYGYDEERKQVFRRDFNLAGGESFDPKWFAGWKTYGDARKGGDLWRSQRLARGARWNVRPFGDGAKAEPGQALLLAANLVAVAGNEQLVLIDREEGRILRSIALPTLVWDGMAAAGGRLYATTADGQVFCLAAASTAATQ